MQVIDNCVSTAQYKITTFTVKYYAHRGSTEPIDTETVYDGGYCANVPTSALSYLTLDHWTNGVDGSTFNPSTTAVTKDLNLYAVSVGSQAMNMALTSGHKSEAYDAITSWIIPNGCHLSISWTGTLVHEGAMTSWTTHNHSTTMEIVTRNIGGDTLASGQYDFVKGDTSSSKTFSVNLSYSGVRSRSSDGVDFYLTKLSDASHHCCDEWTLTATASITIS